MQIFVVAYILRIYLRDINRNSIYNKTLVFIADRKHIILFIVKAKVFFYRNFEDTIHKQ